MMSWRDFLSIPARLRFLEQREDEMTKALTTLKIEQEKFTEARIEIERILPPLRSALATFDQFNKTY